MVASGGVDHDTQDFSIAARALTLGGIAYHLTNPHQSPPTCCDQQSWYVRGTLRGATAVSLGSRCFAAGPSKRTDNRGERHAKSIASEVNSCPSCDVDMCFC